MADELRIGELKFNVNGLTQDALNKFQNRAKEVGVNDVSVFDIDEDGEISYTEYIDAKNQYIKAKEEIISANAVASEPTANEQAVVIADENPAADETPAAQKENTDGLVDKYFSENAANDDQVSEFKSAQELLDKLGKKDSNSDTIDLIHVAICTSISKSDMQNVIFKDKTFVTQLADALYDNNDRDAKTVAGQLFDGLGVKVPETKDEFLALAKQERNVLMLYSDDTTESEAPVEQPAAPKTKTTEEPINASADVVIEVESDAETPATTTETEEKAEETGATSKKEASKPAAESAQSTETQKSEETTETETKPTETVVKDETKTSEEEDDDREYGYSLPQNDEEFRDSFTNLLVDESKPWTKKTLEVIMKKNTPIEALAGMLKANEEKLANGETKTINGQDLNTYVAVLEAYVNYRKEKDAENAKILAESKKAQTENKPFAPANRVEEETMWDGIKQGLNSVAYYTGLKDLNQAIENGDNRIQIVFKETDDIVDVAGAAAIAAGSYLAQPTDAVSYVTKKFTENITEPLNNKITQLQKKAESKTEKAAADLLANTVGGLSEAASSVSNATGGTSDILSSGWKIQPYTNAVIKKSTEETLETLAEMIGGESEIDFNEAKSVIALTTFLDKTKEELSKMTTEEIRKAYKEKYQSDKDSQNKIKRAAIYAAMSELIERNACAMVHQFDDGVNKLDKAQKQIRSGVSGLASSPASLVDVGSGALEDTFGTTGKVIATPFNAVSGLWKTITTSFDGKDGTTKAAFTQCWSGGWADDEVEVQHGITKSESEDAITQEEQREEQKAAFLAMFAKIKTDYAKQYGLSSEQEAALEEVAVEILKNHEYDAMDAQRIAIRAENARLRFPEFMNFMNKVHSNAENAAGDRGFWKNLGAFAEGTLLAIPRDAMNHPLRSMDILTTGICCEIALPTALGLEAVNKAGSSINKLANATTNEAKKKAGYEDGGEALFYALSSAILGYAGATNNQTDCLHGKRHSHRHHHRVQGRKPEPCGCKEPDPVPATPCDTAGKTPWVPIPGV